LRIEVEHCSFHNLAVEAEVAVNKVVPHVVYVHGQAWGEMVVCAKLISLISEEVISLDCHHVCKSAECLVASLFAQTIRGEFKQAWIKLKSIAMGGFP
jgi:hypothetical protein